jgi:putative Holliday junction resolvase
MGGSGRLLGVDWGEKRIGLSLSDPSQTLAQPLATITRRTGRRFPLRKFREILQAHQPVGFVVGLPLESDGTEGEPARLAREMGDLIGRSTGLPVSYADERMTSSRALRAVAEMGGKMRGREGEVDQLAATILLQGFLDSRRP